MRTTNHYESFEDIITRKSLLPEKTPLTHFESLWFRFVKEKTLKRLSLFKFSEMDVEINETETEKLDAKDVETSR